jgi:hypothetical protein
MFTRTFVCEVVNRDSVIVGSRFITVMFWQSVASAYRQMDNTVTGNSAIVNFRRL